ncbi:MAG: lysophospholipid acyltransferase family protein [Bradymonadia bacterium]
MNYLQAAKDWGWVALPAVGFGTVSIMGALVTRENQVSQWCMHQWCKLACKGVGLKPRLVNGELLDSAPQAVLVSNHLSLLDILVLGAVVKRDYRWMAKEGVFKVPFLGWHLTAAGHIPVARGEKAKAENRQLPHLIHEVFEEGADVLIFPEGTRSPDGQIKDFRIGAFRTAVTENKPILPLVIRGTGGLMAKGRLEISEAHAREDITVTVLPPVWAPEEGDDKSRAEALRDAVHGIYTDTLYHPVAGRITPITAASRQPAVAGG